MRKWIKRFLGIDAGSKIRTIVNQFTTIVENLQCAIVDIDGDITDNQIDIQVLKTENTQLGASKVEALKLIKGLNELLGS